MEKIVYLDHSSTTFVKDEVLKEMLPYFNENFGNPSSNYTIGRKNKWKINEARKNIANIIGAKESEIYFTSSGSEADNMIISGILNKNKDKGNHVITTKIEHKAVLNTCKNLEKNGFEVMYLNVDRLGKISLNELEKNITDKTVLVSIMYANNEIGTIQNLEEISKICKKHNVFFHTDAVQAAGYLDLNVKRIGVDAMSLSAHKFYGPKGVGLAYIKDCVDFSNLIYGGGQENNKRAGTENVAGIIGMSKALEIANTNIDTRNKKIMNLRNLFLKGLGKISNRIVVNGDMENRLPGNLNICIKGIDINTVLLMLDMKGICMSSGSACNSNSSSPSHVLQAINVPENIIKNSLRITIGEENTEEEIIYASNILCDIVLNKFKF